MMFLNFQDTVGQMGIKLKKLSLFYELLSLWGSQVHSPSRGRDNKNVKRKEKKKKTTTTETTKKRKIKKKKIIKIENKEEKQKKKKIDKGKI